MRLAFGAKVYIVAGERERERMGVCGQSPSVPLIHIMGEWIIYLSCIKGDKDAKIPLKISI